MNGNILSVIIPVYNSMHSIQELTEGIIDCLEGEGFDFEIILVDDCSKDHTPAKLKELQKRDPRIQAIFLETNHGQQGALKIGLGKAKGETIVTMDDDLEHPPQEIPTLYRAISKGYDIVYGVPKNKKYPFYRKWGSKLVDFFFTVCLGKPKNIRVGSFRIMNRKMCEQILRDPTPFVYITAISLKHTTNIGNVEMEVGKRKYGASNYSFWKLTKLFLQLLYYYKGSYRRYRRSTTIPSQEHSSQS